MPRVFLSYARQDADLARQVARALKSHGLEPWLDETEIAPGDDLLARVAEAVEQADVFCLALTPMALTKRWVMVELRMALSAEIERGKPTVIPMLLLDCEIPVELRHKVYVDFRGRFEAAMHEVVRRITGEESAPVVPKQAVIADMVRSADDELWNRLTAGAGGGDEWSRSDFADVVHGLTAQELEGAVAIGSCRIEYKVWEDSLKGQLSRSTRSSEARARILLQGLIAKGFLAPATDLDYSKRQEAAYCPGSALFILQRAARRSGLFPGLPPPLPERLSALLAYQSGIDLVGNGWHASRYGEPVPFGLEPAIAMMAAVARLQPPRTWAFRSVDDPVPVTAGEYLTPAGLIAGNAPDELRSAPRESERLLGLDMATFDDLGVLRETASASAETSLPEKNAPGRENGNLLTR